MAQDILTTCDCFLLCSWSEDSAHVLPQPNGELTFRNLPSAKLPLHPHEDPAIRCISPTPPSTIKAESTPKEADDEHRDVQRHARKRERDECDLLVADLVREGALDARAARNDGREAEARVGSVGRALERTVEEVVESEGE